MDASRAKIWAHGVGVTAFLLFPILFSPDLARGTLGSSKPFWADFTFSALLVAYFYLSYWVLVPKLYLAKKYFWFGLTAVGCLVVMVGITQFFRLGHPHPHPGGPGFPGPGFRPPPPFFMEVRLRLGLFLFPLTLSVLLRIADSLRASESARQTAELSFLRAQINPHFLFNTLNSIYALALRNSPATPEAIVKLSSLMRYLLEESEQKTVLLAHEVDYIRDYLDLQKLRLGESVRLEWVEEGDISHHLIAPLLLIPFVENAFKHGISPEIESEIRIHIQVGDGKLKFHIWNTRPPLVASNRQGTGHSNTQKRLDLLYPGTYSLHIQDQPDHYSLTLSITLQ